VVFGNGEDNILRGLGGADTLNGGGGSDILRGGRSADKLFGGAGDNILIGGAGKDKLNGGTGSDPFVFNRAPHSPNSSDRDVIQDFELGIDRIDLSGVTVIQDGDFIL
jgi:Ca2+-binding RTX toxin-like protein